MVLTEIVEGIEELSGERCPCLYEYIDAEVLERMADSENFRYVRFEVKDWDVTIAGDGEVNVREN